jgi:hypothetical protein
VVNGIIETGVCVKVLYEFTLPMHATYLAHIFCEEKLWTCLWHFT